MPGRYSSPFSLGLIGIAMFGANFKDYRGFNFGQQMAVLQNQWRLNGAKIVDKTRMHYLCARFARLATNPKARTYDLQVVIPISAEKQK